MCLHKRFLVVYFYRGLRLKLEVYDCACVCACACMRVCAAHERWFFIKNKLSSQHPVIYTRLVLSSVHTFHGVSLSAVTAERRGVAHRMPECT